MLILANVFVAHFGKQSLKSTAKHLVVTGCKSSSTSLPGAKFT